MFYFYAERKGFEPPVPVKALQFSRLTHSTTLPPLQIVIYTHFIHCGERDFRRFSPAENRAKNSVLDWRLMLLDVASPDRSLRRLPSGHASCSLPIRSNPFNPMFTLFTAEREGFEPSIRFETYNRLAICRFQPLSHLSR